MIIRGLRHVLACASLALAFTGAEADVIDQEYVPSQANLGYVLSSATGDGPVWLAQSFTAGLTGQLTSVDLAIAAYTNPQQTVSLQVHEIDGYTLGALLGTATVQAAAIPVGPSGTPFPDFPQPYDPVALRFDLAALAIHVAAGSTYALAVSVGGYPPVGAGDILWLSTQEPVDHYLNGQGLYAYGSALQSGQLMLPHFYPTQGADVGFRTYVSAVPEVPSAYLAALGMFLLAGCASRRLRHGM